MRASTEGNVSTPRTDAFIESLSSFSGPLDACYIAFARQLEAELTALREFTDAHFRLCKGENNL